MIAIGNRLSLRAIGLALLVAAALMASACGSDGDGDSASAQSSGAEEQVMTVMRDFRAALLKSDGDAACALMAKRLVAEFKRFGEGSPCPVAFKKFADSDIIEDLTPSDLKSKVDGDTATISGYVTHLDERQTAHFVKEDGEWKLKIWFRQRG